MPQAVQNNNGKTNLAFSNVQAYTLAVITLAIGIAEALLQLDTLYREVLVLRFHEELSLEEISKVTRAPLSTVKSRLYRGLAAIKPKLERVHLRRQEMV